MNLINAQNIIKGGGVNVLTTLLKYVINTSNEYLVLLPKTKELLHFISFNRPKNFKVIWVPSGHFRFFFKIYFRIFLFNSLKKKFGITKIYSLGNIAINTDVPQVLLIQNAYIFLKDDFVWKRFPFFQRIYLRFMIYDIVKNMKFASIIAVQTNSMKAGLISFYNISADKIFLYPNNITFSYDTNSYENQLLAKSFDNGLELLFLSKYYPHKNFEILPNVCNLIRLKSLKVRIFLTLDPTVREEKNILNKLLVYDDIIFNLGPINSNNLSGTINKYHGLFLPSFIESFSSNYIEALSKKRLIFTSDRDFSREVCGDYAIYFDPFSAFSIVSSFEYFLENLDNKLLFINKNSTKFLDVIYKGKTFDALSSNFLNFNCENSTH